VSSTSSTSSTRPQTIRVAKSDAGSDGLLKSVARCQEAVLWLHDFDRVHRSRHDLTADMKASSMGEPSIRGRDQNGR
jgi:hypothetical protein